MLNQPGASFVAESVAVSIEVEVAVVGVEVEVELEAEIAAGTMTVAVPPAVVIGALTMAEDVASCFRPFGVFLAPFQL